MISRRRLLLGVLCLWLLPHPSISAKSGREANAAVLQDTLMELEVNRKQYDYQLPWTRSSSSIRKSALFIGGNELLTTADGLSDATLIRVQRGGRGRWSEATVAWVDYHANLAIVACKDSDFLKGAKGVELASKLSSGDDYQIHRWRGGNMEVRKAEFNQFLGVDAKLSFVQIAQLELSSEINGVGWGEPIMAGNKLAGLLTSQNRNLCVATPSPFIHSILEARKKKSFHGLGFFDFTWQPSENPSIHHYLGATGEPKGVLVIEGASELGQSNIVRAMDLILQIDGFEIDSQGNYTDPMYGHLLLESLATRNHWAGDDIKIRLLRKGKIEDVVYRLPQANYDSRLMPDYLFDREPEYLILGGLVFQPLSNQYLRSWGDDWKRRAPFRLSYYNNESATKERPALVLLSNVLPDAFNLGYQDTRLLVVDQVNGRKISRLRDLSEAFEHPKDGFHVIEFMQGDSQRKMVLDAKTASSATQRVLDRYGIDNDRVVQSGK